ncbi:IPP transferase-domain-containing protein [Infundibulicybe gibba]|nr:IPP transferase-domain-containing protein [Infundibulicybe gibba]
MSFIITVCGTTGVGKSNLAIQLAHAFPARIINADAMQVYAGLDIITNKVPPHHMHAVDHLLMGFKRPGEQYILGHWLRDAIALIDETHARNQIPIIVGGTSYWIQHLIFPNRLPTVPTTPQVPHDLIASLPPHLLTLYLSLPDHPPLAESDPDAAFLLHSLLTALDPAVAARWHWKDTRKVLRSLRVIAETGQRHSDIMIQQARDDATTKPRYRSLCFWLHADLPALEARLNTRVDSMVQQGLLDEVRTLKDLASTSDTDYTLGIYQSIGLALVPYLINDELSVLGFKEFNEYLSSPAPSVEAFNTAIENMKISTRQYAKRQLSWIRNKFLPAAYAANTNETNVPVYLLDATDLDDKWATNVQEPAVRIARDFLADRPIPDPLSLSPIARQMLTIAQRPPCLRPDCKAQTHLSTCTTHQDRPVMIEEGREWDAHRKTKVHRKLAVRAERPSQHHTRRDAKQSQQPDPGSASNTEDLDLTLIADT